MYPREYFDTFWRAELNDDVFVIMSFDPEFAPVWELAIRPAIEEDMPRDFKARRVDATRLVGSIVMEIFEGIALSRVVFADISVCSSGRWAGQRNGNAMYEIGLAHALRQSAEIVMVRCDDEPINFDLAGIRVQRYDPQDLSSARKLFTQLTDDSLQQVDRTKELAVQRAIAALDGDCINLIMECGTADHFHIPYPKTMRAVMGLLASGKKAAVARLLSLGVIYCDHDPETQQYAYHWTGMGKELVKRMVA